VPKPADERGPRTRRSQHQQPTSSVDLAGDRDVITFRSASAGRQRNARLSNERSPLALAATKPSRHRLAFAGLGRKARGKALDRLPATEPCLKTGPWAALGARIQEELVDRESTRPRPQQARQAGAMTALTNPMGLNEKRNQRDVGKMPIAGLMRNVGRDSRRYTSNALDLFSEPDLRKTFAFRITLCPQILPGSEWLAVRSLRVRRGVCASARALGSNVEGPSKQGS